MFDGSFHGVASGQSLDEAVKEFMDLHQKRWRESDQMGAFAHPRDREGFRALMQELGARGMAKVHTIRSGEHTIASSCTFEFRGTVSAFQCGFDPDYHRLSPGTTLMALRISEALNDGALEFDILRGAESYKLSWANGQRRLYTIEVMTGSWRRHLYHRWYQLRDRLSQSRLVQDLYLRRLKRNHQGTAN